MIKDGKRVNKEYRERTKEDSGNMAQEPWKLESKKSDEDYFRKPSYEVSVVSSQVIQKEVKDFLEDEGPKIKVWSFTQEHILRGTSTGGKFDTSRGARGGEMIIALQPIGYQKRITWWTHQWKEGRVTARPASDRRGKVKPAD